MAKERDRGEGTLDWWMMVYPGDCRPPLQVLPITAFRIIDASGFLSSFYRGRSDNYVKVGGLTFRIRLEGWHSVTCEKRLHLGNGGSGFLELSEGPRQRRIARSNEAHFFEELLTFLGREFFDFPWDGALPPTTVYRSRKVGSVVIVHVRGKLMIGNGDMALRQVVAKHLDDGERNILLNLEKVISVEASGVGELVSAYTTVMDQGGKLKLLSLPPKLTDVLTITKLITVFDVYEDEDTAVRSFA